MNPCPACGAGPIVAVPNGMFQCQRCQRPFTPQQLGYQGGPQQGQAPQQGQDQPQFHMQPGEVSMHVGGVGVHVNTKKLENKLVNEATGMVWTFVIGGIIVVLVVLGLIGLAGYIFYQVKAGSTPTSTNDAKVSDWDGKSTLECDGAKVMKIMGTTATVKDTAIKATGNCQLQLINVNITAPVGIEAGGNAKVTMTGGSIKAKDNSVVAGANAGVTFVGTTVTGPVKKSGNAKVTGAQ